MGTEYALIVYMPESQGPGSKPVNVYGSVSDFDTLEAMGHLLCDGSSGWTFIVVPWPLPEIEPAKIDEA